MALDQHPLPPPAVKTPRPAVPPGLKRSAPTCQRLRRAQSSCRDGRWSPLRPPSAPSCATLRVAFRFRCASAACPFFQDRGLPEASLAGAVVQSASGPAASLMKMWGVMFRALSRVNALFIIYRSHTTDCRGHCGHRSRIEQPQLNPTSTTESESCCGSARRYCTGRASRQQGAMNGSS
jgi:hypothetical protein